ncbi:MAG: bifunctional 4-hydroxy-2-oxoglutarate aldolase/2-dehydro-3-deoxy-phosphogluconate aldolase [Phycisphaerales bacterium]
MSDAAPQTLQAVLADGAVVCIRQPNADAAHAAADAAIAGGLTVIEVTLTTPGALDLMRGLAAREGVLTGGGTVLSPGDLDAVADAGGRFAFSPVFDAAVLARGTERGVLVVPGAMTPTEILTAHRAGAPMVKVFPSAAIGGPAWLRAVRGPLPDIPLIPTSGPTAETIPDWLAAGASAVGVAGDLFGANWTPASATAAAQAIRTTIDACRHGES